MSSPDLLVGKAGKIGFLTLNRPHALNALSLDIIRGIVRALEVWRHDDSVEGIIIRGAGERAFCAGGDIKAAHAMGREAIKFFAEEYRMNRMLFHYPKPLFAVMHGITMGGGFGIAGPCCYRIATDNAVFAMPETGIGFFPDVGSTYFLSRCPGQLGTFMAVTGQTISLADMMVAGIATHYVPAARLEECLSALTDEPSPAALKKFCGEWRVHDCAFSEFRNDIDKIFHHNSMEDIFEALDWLGSVWARELLSVLTRRSPTSMKVALRHVRLAADNDFDEVIERDFTLARHFLEGHEFYEGIRAVVIDKDKNPRWDPDDIKGVTAAALDACFHKTRYNLDNI